MPLRFFERKLENPESNIENEGNLYETTNPREVDEPYEDEFDKRMGASDLDSKSYSKFEQTTKPLSKREAFLQSIRVEQKTEVSPLVLAYRELDRARQSGNREAIIQAEDTILDLERQEEQREYNTRIAELRQMKATAKSMGDKTELARFVKLRDAFVVEMKYDELNYQIKKLQNAQRLSPSRDNLQKIAELRQEMESLEMPENTKGR
ncbi:MAG: hypothetical protein IJJ82_08105 [Clostridia bacterium]|nr:hypothetical protein [Clostridia bacterium]